MTPSEWFKLLYGDEPYGLITIWDRQSKDSQHVGKDYAVNELVESLVNDNRDVYFGVGLRRANLHTKQRGGVKDTVALPGFFLDIDIAAPAAKGDQRAHAANNLPKTLEEALALLEGYPEPTAIVDSGYGLHIYWLFERPYLLNAETTAQVNNLSRQWQERAIANGKKKKLHVDQTGTIDRVLRVPSTINTKTGTPTPVTALITDGPRYQFEALVSSSGFALPTESEPANPEPTYDPTLPIPPDPLRAALQTIEAVTESLKKLKNDEHKALIKPVLEGEPFAAPGARDVALQRIASIIAYLAPDRDPRDLADGLLYASLMHFDDTDAGRWTQEDRLVWATEKIQRAQEDARRDRAITEAKENALLTALISQARNSERRDRTLGAASPGAYTDDELEKFAAQQRTTRNAFIKRWIIQKGQAFFVYVNGDYQRPITLPELDTSLIRDLAPAAQAQPPAVTLMRPDSKGKLVRKTSKELLLDYSSVARTLIADISLQNSYYDETTQTFFEAVCPIRSQIEPAYNPEIDKWLTLLGGKHHGKLLDWIVSCFDLSKQSAALYLDGAPGTGKSLLSQGLARLWSRSPTELSSVLGEWTDDISRCPLVVADEQIPQTYKGSRSSAELRALIGTSSRTLKRKFIPNADMIGCIRLLLTANNSHLLDFNEDLSANDLDAIAERFVHITPDPAARAYLQSIDTSGWVEGDEIAKHALWLSQNRLVTPGKRFLVEGDSRKMANMLATQSGTSGRVTEWIVRACLDTGKAGPGAQKLLAIGNGRIVVNTSAFASFWDYYLRNDRTVPTTTNVGRALRNLATTKLKIKGRHFWEINTDLVVAWAEANGLADSDTMLARINAPNQAFEDIGIGDRDTHVVERF
jgi:hypothetical protein